MTHYGDGEREQLIIEDKILCPEDSEQNAVAHDRQKNTDPLFRKMRTWNSTLIVLISIQEYFECKLSLNYQTHCFERDKTDKNYKARNEVFLKNVKAVYKQEGQHEARIVNRQRIYRLKVNGGFT